MMTDEVKSIYRYHLGYLKPRSVGASRLAWQIMYDNSVCRLELEVVACLQRSEIFIYTA